jgi:hypothetical protein
MHDREEAARVLTAYRPYWVSRSLPEIESTPLGTGTLVAS